ILAELSVLANHVIATGGGVVLREANRELLRRTGCIAWLQSAPETALARLQADPTTVSRRPNLTPAGGLEELRTLIVAREPLYRECADFSIDTAALSPEAVAAAILSACGGSISRQSSGAFSSSFSA
ncbi:MAG TPA: shikimate kinase, partial [Urbifossiella sp.]